MWQKLYEALSRLVTVTNTVEQHDKQIEELGQEVRDLTGLVHRLAMELNRTTDKHEAEKERMQLWVENQLLKFERQLPSAESDRTDDKSTKKPKK